MLRCLALAVLGGIALGLALIVIISLAHAETPKIWWTPKQAHGWPTKPPKYCAQYPCTENRARLR